jgi:hypothetical protein
LIRLELRRLRLHACRRCVRCGSKPVLTKYYRTAAAVSSRCG